MADSCLLFTHCEFQHIHTLICISKVQESRVLATKSALAHKIHLFALLVLKKSSKENYMPLVKKRK